MMMRHILSIAFLFMSFAVDAQQKITGLVEDNETGSPIPYASVTSGKVEGLMTDSSGKFSFVIRKQARLNDSILVTAIGYSSKRIAIKDLLGNNKVKLSQNIRMLEQVKVFASLNGNYQRFGYYREWKVKNEGGEIGYIFDLARKKIQIGMIQVKINHNYDTCWLKLHLRDAAVSGLSLPENEVLKKEVIIPATIKYGLVEFNLNWELITIPTNRLYVGFELLRCGCSQSAAPSFFYMGNAEGINFYKESEQATWKRGGEYTIYVRMTMK
jgi:CarboxypepD_reg-like domain